MTPHSLSPEDCSKVRSKRRSKEEALAELDELVATLRDKKVLEARKREVYVELVDVHGVSMGEVARRCGVTAPVIKKGLEIQRNA